MENELLALEDEDYVGEVTAKIPMWLREGGNELIDNRSIWDWTKYNIRVHAIQHSKRKAMERRKKRDETSKGICHSKENILFRP